jgi:hypothetical protein
MTCPDFHRRSWAMKGGYATKAIAKAITKVATSKSTVRSRGERFGGQAAEMLGATEHRSERIR